MLKALGSGGVGSSSDTQLLYNDAGTETGATAAIYSKATGKITLTPISGRALDLNGKSGNYCQLLSGNSASGNSYGQIITAGTTSADRALRIQNQAATLDFLNVFGDGTILAPLSPLAASTTRVATALAALRTADTTSTNNTLAADASLTLTFGELGHYALEIYLAFYQAIAGTSGFQFDLASGTATVGAISFGLDGFSTAVLGSAGVTAVATASSAAAIATSSSAPSWFLAKGWLQITVAGTLAVRWAQATTSANATTLKAGSYFMATKIG